MRPDVIDLTQFYASRLGQVARRVIRRRIRALWPDVSGLRVLGLGYATPYLKAFGEEPERTLGAMPAQQGVIHWPSNGAIGGAGEKGNLVTLTEETELPFPDSSIDRVLLIHDLEISEQAGALLEEIWRVLTPPGRLLVVVPNRRGIWARFENTPFGHGRPFSPPQLMRLLRDFNFSPGIAESALYVPPGAWRVMLRVAPVFERLGRRWGIGLAGVLVAEAGKQVYAVTAERMPARKRSKGRARRAVPGGVSTRNEG